MQLSEIMSLTIMKKREISIPECIIEEIESWNLQKSKFYKSENIGKLYCFLMIRAGEKPFEITIVDLMKELGFGDELYVTKATALLEEKEWISVDRSRNPYTYRVRIKK